MESTVSLLVLIPAAVGGPDPWIVIGGGAFLLLCLLGLVAIGVIGFVTLRKK